MVQSLSDGFGPDFEEQVQLLCELGLTPIQAKMYLELLQAGEVSARSIADALGINRIDVYRALQKLQKFGIVEVSIGKPNKFVAVEPRIATSLLMDSLKKDLSELSKKADFLTGALESMTRRRTIGETPETETQYFKLKSGGAVTETILSMVKQAKHEIRKMLTARALGFHLLYGILDVERELAQKGIKIKVITDAPSEISAKYAEISQVQYAGDLRETLRYIIIDESMIIISLAANAVGPADSVGLLTNNSTLIHALTKHFEETCALASTKT